MNKEKIHHRPCVDLKGSTLITGFKATLFSEVLNANLCCCC